MTTETQTITDKKQKAIDKAWDELWDFAELCISIRAADYERFLEEGKKRFDVTIKETE